MKKLLFGLLFLINSASSSADSDTDLWVVEIAMFQCAFCAEIEKHTGTLEALVDGRFVFAPIGATRTDPLVPVYYMARGQQDRRKLRELMFKMTQKMRYQPKTVTEVIEYLRAAGLRLDEDEMAKIYRSGEVEESVKKSLYLLNYLNPKATPGFVFIRGGEVIGSMVKGRESSMEFLSKAEEVVKKLRSGASL